VADVECFAGGVDDLGGDGVEVVDLLDALDLGEQSVDEAEVAAGDAGDGGDGDGAGPPVGVVGGRVSRPAAGGTAVSSSLLSGRYSWANLMRL